MTSQDAAGAAAPATMRPRILVLATAGLARFVPALGAMGAIRANHAGAHIVLLTARATSAFAATAPYFDEVWIDDTDGKVEIRRLWSLRARLNAAAFDRVYDLDATAHSRRLFWAMYGRRALPMNRGTIPWSGEIPGTALSYTDSRRTAMHLLDRWSAQLRLAGIGAVLRADMSWVARQVQAFNVPFRMTEPFVLLAPAPGPGTAWPALRYGELARALVAMGQIPVIVGPDVPAESARAVVEFAPATVDLTGRATVNEMVFLAWAATAAIGPDNGTMHLVAASGCRSVVLYNGASDPALVGQRGNRIAILRRPQLAEITVGEVLATLETLKK